MTRIVAVLPYGPSNSCADLRNALQARLRESSLNATARQLRSVGSAFRPTDQDFIINYGNRAYEESFYRQANVLNRRTALSRAANKLTAFRNMAENGIPTVEYTTESSVANSWIQAGCLVYQRDILNGHSGEGIVVHSSGQVGEAPLYTKAITGGRREWRVHIFKGKISYVQLKKRRDGWAQNPDYRDDVRNHHTGWIYSTNPSNIVPSVAVLRAAFDAVRVLGLDFGAVDIISRADQAWVLEVNTAPGLSGTTLEVYTDNIFEYVKSVMTNSEPQYHSVYEVPPAPVQPVVEEENSVEVVPVVAAQEVSAPVTQHEEVQSNNGPTVDSSYERGFYLGDLRNPMGHLVASNVILYVAQNRIFRHGWNLPIPPREVINLRKINSVQLADNTSAIVNI